MNPWIFPSMDLYLIAIAGKWTWDGSYERKAILSVDDLMIAMDTDQRDIAEAMHRLLRGKAAQQ